MSIVRKMIVGYIFLIFIPVVTFGYYYYSKIYDSVSSQFVESRQKILEQAYANMKADLARIDSTQRMLQYNPYVTDYLDGSYETDSESIYAYNRYINPVILQSLNISPEIDTFRIYITKQGVLPITDRLLELSALDEQGAEATRMLRPGQGKWIIPDPEVEAPPLVFYQKIYNNDFTEIVGLLEARVGSGDPQILPGDRRRGLDRAASAGRGRAAGEGRYPRSGGRCHLEKTDFGRSADLFYQPGGHC